MQKNRIGVHSIQRVKHVEQALVLDVDEGHRVLGDVLGDGGYRGHGMAVEQHLAPRQHLLAHVVLSGRGGAIGPLGPRGYPRKVRARDDGRDAGQCLSPDGVDPFDSRVGVGAAQHLADQHPGQLDVGAELRLPGDLLDAVDLGRPLPDDAAMFATSYPHRPRSRGIASGESTEQIIGQTVHLISLDFPTFRVAYSTIDEQGGITVVDSVEPPGMPKLAGLTGDLSAAPQYLRELREGHPVIIEDTTKDPRIAPLSDKMEYGSTLALVDMPLAHSDQLVGLICFDSSTPRQWADDEIALLPEVAEYLSIALRDAHLRQAREEADEEARVTSLRLHTGIEDLQIGVLLEDNA